MKSASSSMSFKAPFVILLFAVIQSTVGCQHRAEQQTANETEPLPAVQWPQPSDSQARAMLDTCQQHYRTAVEIFTDLTSSRARSGQELLRRINQLDIQLDGAAGLSSLYRNVHPNEAVREIADACQQNVLALATDINLSRPLYERVAAIDLNGYSTIDRRFVEKMLTHFELAGVNQNKAARTKIRALHEEITAIGQTFNRNIREDRKTLAVSAEALQGLPEDFISARAQAAGDEIVISTDYPDYIPVMQYAQDDEVRRQLYELFRNRAYPENKEVLRSLLLKRYELAQLLGYDNYAQYVTSDKMIESPAKAQTFIDKVSAIAQPRSDHDYQLLLAALRQIQPSASRVGDWQKTYLEEKIKQEKYTLSSQEVREYFSYESVRDGIFRLVEHLFNVEIRHWETDTWHQSVEAYELWEEGELIGQFYLDMHPREGKYKHAAAFGVREGVQNVQIPRSALVCNFPGGDGSRGLMEHQQVETFLHEFGHLLHALFAGHQPWLILSGISNERDFVEAPSQMLEEWVWDYDTLKTFAKNAQGEVIPQSLVAKMNAARDFGLGLWTQHQLFYAALSLNYYNLDPNTMDIDETLVTLQNRYSPFDYVPGTHQYASFGHLDGYSAMYYTYMWSLVIASDMFSEFERAGLRNPETAQHYRESVLAPGSAKPAAELVQDFLGRPYNFEAFSHRLEAQETNP